MNNKIITIIGNVGAGKTTCLPLVAKALNADVIRADELFQVNPFRDKFLNDISRWGFTSELYLVHKRISLIKKSIQESNKPTIIIDSGLLMSWVYTKSHYLSGKISLDEWLLFDELFFEWSPFALHTTVLYLTATEETLLQRIKKRHREYEVIFYNKEYLKQLEIGLRDLCANFSKEVKRIVQFDTSNLNLVDSIQDKKHFIEFVKNEMK